MWGLRLGRIHKGLWARVSGEYGQLVEAQDDHQAAWELTDDWRRKRPQAKFLGPSWPNRMAIEHLISSFDQARPAGEASASGIGSMLKSEAGPPSDGGTDPR